MNGLGPDARSSEPFDPRRTTGEVAALWRARPSTSLRTDVPDPFEEETRFDVGVTDPEVEIELRHTAIGVRTLSLAGGDGILIGRAGSDVQVSLTWDKHVSRRHALLWCADGEFLVRDLGSRNGIWIDQQRVDGVARLHAGATVCVGATRLRVRLGARADGAPVARLPAPAPEPDLPRVPTELLAEPVPICRVAPVKIPAPAVTEDLSVAPEFEIPILEPEFVPEIEPEAPSSQRHPALDVLGPFLDGVEGGRLYDGLGIPPTASETEVRARADLLRATFEDARDELAERYAEPLERALRLLDTATEALTTGRLEHDFRHGYDRAEARLRLAGQPGQPSLEALEAAWRRAQPERVKHAQVLLAQAQQARQRGELDRTLALARAAVRDDPFNAQVRERFEFWKMIASSKR